MSTVSSVGESAAAAAAFDEVEQENKAEGDGQSEETQNSFICANIKYVPAPVGDGDVSDRCTLCIEDNCNCWIPVYSPDGIETIEACTPDGTTCKKGGINLGTPSRLCGA